MDFKKTGVLTAKDLHLPSHESLKKGVAIIECIQEIPCDPCVDACPFTAITMENLNAPPKIDYDKCTGCGKCVGICPGLAIFVVQVNTRARITLPYEFYPIPCVGEMVKALNREGDVKVDAKVIRVKKLGGCALITIEIDKGLEMEIRNIRVK